MQSSSTLTEGARTEWVTEVCAPTEVWWPRSEVEAIVLVLGKDM